MKLKKIGENILVLSGLFLFGYVVYFYNKQKSITESADKIQLSNRFIEFFDSLYIEDAYNKYAEYINMGFSPQSAFEMTIGEE
jgi:hypothetical protein